MLSYGCHWLNHTMTILCDGRVTCGLDDPHGVRSYGNVYHESLKQIWQKPDYQKRREALRQGKLCIGCKMYQPASELPIESRISAQDLPGHLVIEPSIRCNLNCPQPSCIPNNAPNATTRNRAVLDLGVYKSVIDQMGERLGTLYLYNYGEPLINPHFEDMVAYARTHSPKTHIVTSTNGILLAKKSRAEKLVAAGIDSITFTIGGMNQEAYSKYHVGGRLDQALAGLRNMVEAKHKLGKNRPEIYWRYLAFCWNDSDAELEAALQMSREIGVDKFRFHLTRVPASGISTRLLPGTALHEKYRSHIDYSFAYDDAVPNEHGVNGANLSNKC